MLEPTVMLSLCDRTAAMCLPWAEAGYVCYAVDVQHPEGVTPHPLHENIRAVGASVFDFTLDRYVRSDIAFVAAFPPCTHLSVSGARWWEGKELARLAELYPDESLAAHRARLAAGETPVLNAAVALVERCAQIAEDSDAPWCLENPIGRLPSNWSRKKYQHLFHPWHYGGYEGGEDDGYTKKTCLWVGNGFVMPERKPIPLAEDHDRIHKAAPSDDRGDIRSVTPAGFARAVFEANAPDRLLAVA